MRIQTHVMFLLILAVVAPGAWAQTWEVGGGFTGYFPHDSLWRSQIPGHEFKLAYWTADKTWGMALHVGQTSWDVDTQAVRHTDAVTDTLSGQADFRSVGLALLTSTQIHEAPWFRASLGAGLDYVTCDTDMRVIRALDTGGGTTDTESFALETLKNHGWSGRLVAGLELSPHGPEDWIKFLVQLGYQFDLDPIRVTGSTWLDYQRKLDFSGGFVQLGMLIALP